MMNGIQIEAFKRFMNINGYYTKYTYSLKEGHLLRVIRKDFKVMTPDDIEKIDNWAADTDPMIKVHSRTDLEVNYQIVHEKDLEI